MIQPLKGLPAVGCFVYSVIVIVHNQAKHEKWLRAVLDRPLQEGLTFHLDNYLFSFTRFKYFGQFVDGQGIRKDLTKS